MQNTTNVLNAISASLLRNKLHKIKYALGLMLCVAGIGLPVTAAPSDLDPAFGAGGKVISSPDTSQTTYGSGIALLPDGKIIMVGGNFINPGNLGFVVARYNADGSLDTTFNSSGWTSVTFGYSREGADSVAIQPDGKIVVGGTLLNGNSGADIGIARFNANGSLDTSFDGDGKLVVFFGSTQTSNYDNISAIKIANDGKIVFAGGTSPTPLTSNATLVRLNPDGSFDTSFDGDGKVMDGGGKWEDLILQPDGTMHVAGHNSLQFQTIAYVAKFDNTGTRVWTYTRAQDFVIVLLNGIAAQPDGKLVAVGGHGNKIIAVRLNADGSVDNSFSIPATPPPGEAYSVAIQSDGKIVANAKTDSSGSISNNFSLIRYNTDGSQDSGFGTGGIVTTNMGENRDHGREVLIQPDGKILVGGWVELSSSRYFAMARYKGGPKTLFDYDGDGKADISVFRASENKWYVLRSSDGQVAQQIFAASGDVPVPSDYDGDGKTDMAIYRPSSADWWSLSTVNGNSVYAHWGEANAIARPSDFDGDGKTDYIFYLPSNSTWYRYGSSVGASTVTFGSTGDKPVTGDFDGDGKSDVAIYRPSTGDWWYAASSAGGQHRAEHWGISTDVPAPADYDGDGKTDFAVYRPSNGVWYIYNSSNNSSTIMSFGISEDKPVPADYDGDGKTDIAVFRPSNGAWYLLRSTAGFTAVSFGVSTDIPTPNAFLP